MLKAKWVSETDLAIDHLHGDNIVKMFFNLSTKGARDRDANEICTLANCLFNDLDQKVRVTDTYFDMGTQERMWELKPLLTLVL